MWWHQKTISIPPKVKYSRLTLWLCGRRGWSLDQRCLWAGDGWGRYAGRCAPAPPRSADWPSDAPRGWDGTRAQAAGAPEKKKITSPYCACFVQGGPSDTQQPPVVNKLTFIKTLKERVTEKGLPRPLWLRKCRNPMCFNHLHLDNLLRSSSKI